MKVRDVIDHDMAVKCGRDVSDAIHRNFRLLDSQRGCMLAGVAAASTAMASMLGAWSAGSREDLDAKALDALWLQLIRPLALTTIGDRTGFERLLEEVSAKPDITA